MHIDGYKDNKYSNPISRLSVSIASKESNIGEYSDPIFVL